MKCKYFILLMVLFFSLTYPVTSESQGENSGFQLEKTPRQSTRPSKDREIHEILETLRETHLIKELQLSEKKANAVIEKVRYTRKLRKGYLLRRHTIENELNALLDLPTPDQTKINSVLQKLEIVKQQYYQKIMEADEKLRHMLTPEEQAKYVLFQRNFNKKLKDVISNIRRQRVNTPTKRNQLLRRQATESVIRQPR